MAVDQVSIRLQSPDLDALGLQRLVGYAAGRVADRGTPVSARTPDGPTHQVTTIVYEAVERSDLLDDRVRGLGPVLTRLVALASTPAWSEHGITADLVVSVTGAPLGFEMSLEPATVVALGQARCGLVVDAYDSEED